MASETKAFFNIDNFKTELRKSGIARTNRFEVIIAPPKKLRSFPGDARLVNLYCDVSNLPGMSIPTKGLKLYGPAYQRPVSIEFNGEAINMSFYLDRDMRVKTFFDSWMFSVVSPNSFNVNYASDYETTIQINQYDEQDNYTYGVILEKAFPRAMSLVDLSAGSTNQASKLNVTFAYRAWISSLSRSASNFKLGYDILYEKDMIKKPYSFTPSAPPTTTTRSISPPNNNDVGNFGNPAGDVTGAPNQGGWGGWIYENR